jgi:hypothetical protein
LASKSAATMRVTPMMDDATVVSCEGRQNVLKRSNAALLHSMFTTGSMQSALPP